MPFSFVHYTRIPEKGKPFSAASRRNQNHVVADARNLPPRNFHLVFFAAQKAAAPRADDQPQRLPRRRIDRQIARASHQPSVADADDILLFQFRKCHCFFRLSCPRLCAKRPNITAFEENIFLSLFAKTISNAKLVAKVNRLAYDDIIDSLDIGSVIYPKYITADYILQYVRATQNSIGSNVETLYHILDGKAEALEFKICDNSPIVGRTLSELNLKKNLLVGCLYRDGSVRIPRGHDALEIGDRVVIVTTNRGLRDINDILAK